MTNKVTKQELLTRLAIVEAKLDKVLDLLQKKEVDNAVTIGTTGCLVCGSYDCPAAYTNLPCKNYPVYGGKPFWGDRPEDLSWGALPTTKDDVEE